MFIKQVLMSLWPLKASASPKNAKPFDSLIILSGAISCGVLMDAYKIGPLPKLHIHCPEDNELVTLFIKRHGYCCMSL